METVAIAEGILTAPPSHHAFYGYFFHASKQATKEYVTGHNNNGVKRHAFLFKKGCKQGSSDATDLYCYGATYLLRVMANALRQEPGKYGYVKPSRSTTPMADPMMAHM